MSSKLDSLPRELRDQIYECLGVKLKVNDVDCFGLKIKCRHVFLESDYFLTAHAAGQSLHDSKQVQVKSLLALARSNKLFHAEIIQLLSDHAILVWQIPIRDTCRVPNLALPTKFSFLINSFGTLVLRAAPNTHGNAFVFNSWRYILQSNVPRASAIKQLILIPLFETSLDMRLQYKEYNGQPQLKHAPVFYPLAETTLLTGGLQTVELAQHGGLHYRADISKLQKGCEEMQLGNEMVWAYKRWYHRMIKEEVEKVDA